MSSETDPLSSQIANLSSDQSNELLQLVMATAPVGMAVLEALRNQNNRIVDFRFKLANHVLEAQTGIPGLTTSRLSGLLARVSPAIPINQWIEIVNANTKVETEIIFSGDNGFCWLKVTLKKFGDGVMLITEDITNKTRNEEQIRQQTVLFTKVIESSPDVIQIVSLTSGKSVYINKMILEELKYPFERIKEIEAGKGVVSLIHPDDTQGYDTFLENIRNSGNDDTIEGETRLQAFDGSWRWYKIRAKVFERDQVGTPLKFLAFSQDVTLQRSAEEEKRNHEMLQEVEKARTAFFSNVSHELRTPLTLLLAPLHEIIVKQGIHDADMDKIQMAYRNALRLQKTVNILLDFSRIESGRVDALFQPTDLAAYTADLASNFRTIIEHAKIKFKVRCEPLDQPVYINREMYEKILFNLLSNAFKYTFNGKIEVILKGNTNHVKLIVHDTGVGIAQKHLDIIFDRFVRIEGKKARTYEGSGIGLSFVRELVSYHKGTIKVSSQVDKGTTFTVTLLKGKRHLPKKNIFESKDQDLANSAAASYVEELKSWTTGFHGIEDRGRVKSKRNTKAKPVVLVVDDNADMRSYLKRLLSENYEVVVAANGKAAVEAIAPGKLPDLILSDVMMPEVNGYELLQAIKRNECTKDIPVILVTAKAGEESTVEGLKIGADDYLVKPFSAKEMLARVDARIQITRARTMVTRALADVNNQLEEKVAQKSTELVDANATLTRKNAELRNLSGDLSTFAFVASHDLAEPLRKIQFFTSAIQTDDASTLSDKGRDAFDRIYASVDRMKSLIEDIRTYSRSLAALQHIEPVNLADIVEQLKITLGAAVQETNAVIEYHNLPVLMGNPLQIFQVFQNLLSNSLKFQEPGARPQIIITAETVPGIQIHHPLVEDHKLYHRIEVKDNGLGFDQIYEEKIFQIFQRLHNRTQYPGRGVGLAVCKKLMENHSGFIAARSQPGNGASFFCYFPI